MSQTRCLSHEIASPLLERFLPPAGDLAEDFHTASKFARSIIDRQEAGVSLLVRSAALLEVTARSGKRYPQLSRSPLPAPAPLDASLDEILAARKTASRFAEDPVRAADVSAMLSAAYGKTHVFARPEGGTVQLRAVPSAGALYPLDVYLLAKRVDGIEPGLHHFDVAESATACLRRGDAVPDISKAFSQEALVAGAAAVFIVTATFARSRFKYGLRSYRFTLLEAGHLVQNLLLASTALRLASAPMGGFYDAELEEMLGFDGVNESVLYVVPVGA